MELKYVPILNKKYAKNIASLYTFLNAKGYLSATEIHFNTVNHDCRFIKNFEVYGLKNSVCSGYT